MWSVLLNWDWDWDWDQFEIVPFRIISNPLDLPSSGLNITNILWYLNLFEKKDSTRLGRWSLEVIAQKNEISIKDFVSKCDQICRKILNGKFQFYWSE